MLLLNILIFVIALVILGFASRFTMKGSLYLLTLTRVSDYTIAFFLIGLAAAIPEIFIVIFSSLFGVPGLSFGNIIGANIAALTLSLGLPAYFSQGLKIDNHFSKKTFWATVLLGLLPTIVSLDGLIGRTDGILLIIIFCLYSWVVLMGMKFISMAVSAIPFSVFHIKEAVKTFKKNAIGHILLLLSTAFLVIASINISQFYSISPVSFGVIFLGLATTLPKLFLNTEAGVLRNPSIIMGTVLGGIAINSTAVLGLLAVISPVRINVDPFNILLNGLFLLTIFLLFRTLAYTGKRVSQAEGILLAFIYVLFFISQLYFF
ncbi:MAG: hypothetical protein HZA94_03310 [Candidatus Vogelbacteria bacterium]|nr:hypothetical protein [Candidatus Vogelbacteria bacterium]